jgi:putative peptide zinc metalloprotease protein
VTRAGSTLAVLLILVCAPPAGAQAGTPGHDNVASASTETDGSRVSDFAWDVTQQRGGDVEELNSATATARCTDCAATAIAFQIVLVSGTPQTIAPHNRAVAINDQCTRCVVAAEARQFVRVVDQPVKLTAAGREELANVRQDLRTLAGEGLAPADLHAAVEQDEARVQAVLSADVVPKSDAGGHVDVLKARLLQATDAN